MTKTNQGAKNWSKPELTKLGELKDVAGGTFSGNDSNGNGGGAKTSVTPPPS